MSIPATLESFLDANRITQADWQASGCDWPTFQAIAEDYECNRELFRETAETFARLIQKFPAVHSVRWRVKDVSHLLEKIVRKCRNGSDKYASLTAANYKSVVTDLVGIRALHLFKDDCFAIDPVLRETWRSAEPPVAYLRTGDDQSLREAFKNRGIETKDHAAGYRSLHYVLASKLTQREIFVEVQVRTVIEEAWSEIDHRVRYPNFKPNPQVDYFLAIFNRTAGSADEMGSFVRTLATSLAASDSEAQRLASQRDEALEHMKQLVAQLSDSRRSDQAKAETIAGLGKEIERLSAVAAWSPVVQSQHSIGDRDTVVFTHTYPFGEVAQDEMRKLLLQPSVGSAWPRANRSVPKTKGASAPNLNVEPDATKDEG